MTVVAGRLGFGLWARLGPTTAALGPPTSVGVGCSLQAASRATSAEVTIKRRCIDVLLRGKRSMHGNPSRCLCLLRLSINRWTAGHNTFLLLSYRRRSPTLAEFQRGHAAHRGWDYRAS